VDSSDVEWLRQLEDDVRSGKRRADESVCLAARVGARSTGVGRLELGCSISWALGKLAPGPITAEDAAVELACGLARDERRRQVRESLALLPPAAEEAAPEVTAALVEECRRPPPVAAEDDDVWLGAVVGRVHELNAELEEAVR
jgi:hypothetical protein